MAMVPMVEFDEATHSYRVNGVAVPFSVTQIITLGGLEVEPTAAARDAYYMAGLAGRFVHEACDLYDRGKLRPGTVDPYIAVKVAGWQLAREREEIEVLALEKKIANTRLGYAGTLDRIVEMRRDKRRVRAILDLKQSWDVPPPAGVQLAGYDLAEHDAMNASGIGRVVVHLKPKQPRNGGPEEPAYKVVWYDDPEDYAAFLGALGVARWRVKRGVPLPEVAAR